MTLYYKHADHGVKHGRKRTNRAGETNSARGANQHVQTVELGLHPAWDDVDPRWDEERGYDEAFGPADPHHRPTIRFAQKVG